MSSEQKIREIDSSEEEEEDEEEEPMDDLINDEEEEEEEESSEDDEKSGGKRSHDDDDVSSSVDEDDYELMREAGISVPKKKKKQFKRIRRIADSDEEAEPDDGRTAIERDLFPERGVLDSDEDDENPQPKPRSHDLDLNLDSDEDESDPDDNFIVDDNDQPIRQDKRKKHLYADAAMAEAHEVFGGGYDFDEFNEDDGDEDDYEEEEDYEGEDETGVARPRRKRGAKPITEVFEPAELERHLLTKRDQEIRDTDMPERFQLRSTPVTSAEDEELEQEAQWIYNTAMTQKSELIVPEIKYALNCIRNEKLDLPHIAAYRREYLISTVTNFDDIRDLIVIYEHDALWCDFKKSKETRLKSLKDMQEFLKTTKPEGTKFRPITDYDFKCVESASTFNEVDYCRRHFDLYYSSFFKEMKQRAKEVVAETTENGQNGTPAEDQEEAALIKKTKTWKISAQKTFYQHCCEESIDEIVSKYGLTPEQFGENLRQDYQRNNVAQCPKKPTEVAADVLEKTTKYKTPEDCLKKATHLYARMLANDPTVCQIIGKNYFENAVINVKATPNGMNEIDENHPCYPTKFLRNKPISKLEAEQILEIFKAEQADQKLLDVSFSIEPIDHAHPHISPYHESLKALYYSDFSSMVTKEWNDQREEAIKICTSKILFPYFEKLLRERLLREAQEKTMNSYCVENLHKYTKVAPYSAGPAFDDYEDFELRNGIRICGFTFAPEGDSPCFAAIIDPEGELIDHVRLPYLNMRKRPDRMNAQERENHAKDRQKLKQFIIHRKPHVVALGAETIQTKYICQDLAQILDELRDHDGLPLIPIEIVNNDLSNVYMNSKRAAQEFPDFPPLLLQAISNARRLHDPLLEFAKLFNVDDDILSFRFHSLQDDLPRDRLLEALRWVIIARTNAVGVDPNRAIAHPHTADVVQFIAGLGPRKAKHLLHSIKDSSTGGQLVSRQQLVTEHKMTSVIFINCAGFIKLDTDALSDDFPDEHITPLDSTRIHPQAYGLAKKIASDALDYEDEASDETTANVIEEILEAPEKLDDLDLNAFAQELDRQNRGKKSFTLYSIREEFQVRYRDHRESYRAPSQEEIFAMLTKETPTTFYIGKLIICQVSQIIRKKPNPSQLDLANPVKIDETNLWRCPFCMKSDFTELSVVWNHFDTNDCPGYAIGVRCRIDNGLSGFIPTKFISDSEVSDPSQRVTPGQTIVARVIKIDTDKFSCDLTCRSSDLNDEAGKLKPAKDEFYDESAERALKRELEAKARKATRKPYQKRVIVHPAFENIDFKSCEKKLATMEQGHAIIRPSSAGQNFLTVSWKVCDGVNQHVNIREDGKANAFSLGQQLYIENECYEDLDEIIARYVQPMASYARELLNYKYCIKPQDGLDEIGQIQNVLFTEKQKNPNSFPYRFCPSRKLPGKFIFGYLPSVKPKIEYLTVSPRGYRFRSQYFKNLAMLIKWFKSNWNRAPPPAYPSVTPGLGDSVRQTFPMSQ